MVHEMVHTALPDLDDRYAWLSEGLAVYVEPIARVQAGDLTAKEIWQAMMRDMPKGLPQAGDQGLDNTDTWGRRYWGGAMFCLLADIEIRKRTGNRLGLQDAMRGVIAAGGNHEQDWSIDRVLATADKAVGVDVLTRLHNEMGPKPVTPDLAATLARSRAEIARRRVSNSTIPHRLRRSARRSRSPALIVGSHLHWLLAARYRSIPQNCFRHRAGMMGRMTEVTPKRASAAWPVFRSLASFRPIDLPVT